MSEFDSLSSVEESTGGNLALGFGACAVAILCFGSSYVPAKKFHSGDGFFYQWVMCCAIFLVGLIEYAVRGFPKFEPVAMLGGALWCIGNCMAIPIIEMVGMAIGFSVWGVANCVTGWASGCFGILGVEQQPANIPSLNYIGACVAVVSIVLLAVARASGDSSKKDDGYEQIDPFYSDNTSIQEVNSVRHGPGSIDWQSEEKSMDEGSFLMRCIGKLSTKMKIFYGLFFSIVSGFFYGVNFNPPQYRIDHATGDTSTDVLDYVFPHFTGIFVMSTIIFLAYAAIAGNNPPVYRRTVLPGMASGAIWAIAQIGWFIANQELSFTISFPIITSGPSIVASLWGILAFHEIKGKKSILLILLAFTICISGVVCITLSKVLGN